MELEIIPVLDDQELSMALESAQGTTSYPCQRGERFRVQLNQLRLTEEVAASTPHLSPKISDLLKADWQSHVLACSGYIELGMLDSAAEVLEEIAPEDKNRNEVLSARVVLYMAAKIGTRPRQLPATS